MFWPDGAYRSVIAVAQPPVGTVPSYRESGAVEQRLIAVSFTLATSAVVATRTPHVRVTDGAGAVIADAVAGWAITASSTLAYSYAEGLSEWLITTTNTVASGPCPLLVLGLGDTLSIQVDAIDVGDQISAVKILAVTFPVRSDLEQ